MNCDKCKSARVEEIRGRCKDQFHAKMGSIESEGYVDRRWVSEGEVVVGMISTFISAWIVERVRKMVAIRSRRATVFLLESVG
jgi:hypothetical protein